MIVSASIRIAATPAFLQHPVGRLQALPVRWLLPRFQFVRRHGYFLRCFSQSYAQIDAFDAQRLHAIVLIIVRVYLRAGRRIEIEQLPGQTHFHKAIAVAKIGERVVGRVRGIERALPQAAVSYTGRRGAPSACAASSSVSTPVRSVTMPMGTNRDESAAGGSANGSSPDVEAR